MEFTRRDLGKIAIASVPLSRAFAAKMIDSKFGGVQIGAITYSFNRIASPISTYALMIASGSGLAIRLKL